MTLDRFLLIIQNASASKNKTQIIGIKMEPGFLAMVDAPDVLCVCFDTVLLPVEVLKLLLMLWRELTA